MVDPFDRNATAVPPANDDTLIRAEQKLVAAESAARILAGLLTVRPNSNMYTVYSELYQHILQEFDK